MNRADIKEFSNTITETWEAPQCGEWLYILYLKLRNVKAS